MRFCTSRPAEKSEGMVNRTVVLVHDNVESACRGFARVGVVLGEACQGLLPGGEDSEKLVELGDDEDFEDLGFDVGQAQLAVFLPDAMVGVNEHSEGCAAEMLDVGEIQEDFGIFLGIDERSQGSADVGDVGLVEDFLIAELDDADVLLVVDQQWSS